MGAITVSDAPNEMNDISVINGSKLINVCGVCIVNRTLDVMSGTWIAHVAHMADVALAVSLLEFFIVPLGGLLA